MTQPSTSRLVTEAANSTVSAADRSRTNHTGTQTADTIVDGTTNKAYTAAEKTKLTGIAAGATVNRADTATDAAITAAINGLVNGAASALDTLSEIDAQLAADEGSAAALATTVAGKAPLASPAFTGSPTLNGSALISANALGTANNPVASQTAARPTGLTRVYWAYASATPPTNGLPGDIFENIS